MICFKNAWWEYEEAIKYAKHSILINYSEEMMDNHHITGPDCSMFALNDAKLLKLVTEDSAFMTWMNKPAGWISNNKIIHMKWGKCKEYMCGQMVEFWNSYSSPFECDCQHQYWALKYMRAHGMVIMTVTWMVYCQRVWSIELCTAAL